MEGWNYACKTFNKLAQASSFVKPAFLLNCINKITPCACFLVLFEPVVRFFSASEISRPSALSDIPADSVTVPCGGLQAAKV